MKAHIQEIPTIAPVPLSHLRKIADSLKDKPDDMPLSFEFLMSAFFPVVFNNIQAHMKKMFNDGYVQGLKDANQGKEKEDKE